MTVMLSGFADEISPDPRAQLAALAAESISHLELRSAWSVNIADLTDLGGGGNYDAKSNGASGTNARWWSGPCPPSMGLSLPGR